MPSTRVPREKLMVYTNAKMEGYDIDDIDFDEQTERDEFLPEGFHAYERQKGILMLGMFTPILLIPVFAPLMLLSIIALITYRKTLRHRPMWRKAEQSEAEADWGFWFGFPEQYRLDAHP